MNRKALLPVVMILLVSMILSACAKATSTVEPTQLPSPTEAAAQTIAPSPTEAEVAVMACPEVTGTNMMGLESDWPGQFELIEFETKVDCELVFSGNPLFADQPPVEERLPDQPLVVIPYEEIGTYGGKLRGTSFAPESGTSDILSWRHVNLVRYSDDLQTIVPDVATSWEWNEDYTEITFTLRKGHKWSDGKPFTVDDILFWWEDIKLNTNLTPELPGYFMYGGEPLEIEKNDDVTFTVSFNAPSSGFLVWVAHSYIQPWQPKHFLSQFHLDYNPDANELAEEDGYDDWVALFRSYYHDWKDSYHRLGVPTLESHVLAEETTEIRRVVANPYYYKVDTAGQQLPYVNEHYESFIADKEVTNLKIIAGEVDLKIQGIDVISYPVYKENEGRGNYAVQLPPSGFGQGVIYILNVTHKDQVTREIFSDVRFKQALSLALDREEINEVAYLGLAKPMQGLPADPVTLPFVTEEMATYMIEQDLAQANALLDEMGLEKNADGWRLRSDGKVLTIYMEYCQQGGPALVHELVKEYWEALGVKVELKEVSTEVYRTRTLQNDHDLAVWVNDNTAAPTLIGDPQRFYPPFVTGLAHFTGGPWYAWWQSGGTEGEEPPDWAKDMRDLALEFGGAMPYGDEWMDLGAQLVQMHLDQMIGIGTVGESPAPVIVHNRLGNTPELSAALWDYYWWYPFRIDQYFIKE